MKKSILLASCLFLTTILSGQVTDGLVAKYYFNNGTLEDEVGDVDGIPNNTFFTYDRFMNPEKALGFDLEANSNVSFGDSFDDVFAIPDSAFSFSFWFKTRDTSNTNTLLLSKYGNANCWEDQREFFIRINSGKTVEFLYYSTLVWSEYRSIYGTTLIEDTLWHHVVFNYDGSQDGNDGHDRVEIYLDNEQEETILNASGILGDIQDGTAHLSLGVPLSSSGNICGQSFFHGAMDDIRFYSRNLTSEEVDTLFNEDNPFSGLSESSIKKGSVLHPNPANHIVKIELPPNSFDNIIVFTILGQEVVKLQGINGYIDVSVLEEGLYFIQILKENKLVLTEKLIIGRP